ncbi:pyruvate dehydrogenase complex dihydrolipoamide acetyltransferase [Plasmopara halstedii]|uniref:Dihydrolipoamide acetyltransferase component of pyruvate dehydrogenase complex n=1 Tax=Plasmopara halstedii TaxID=4781 RepID=A0A0P1AXK5_PLAHL|nr:pyruvate dehydrogenase complex dihydrolipoamide acetyltransferase [Plasmopara halstedii]CEG46177.1 pyruvate dehydrogenase complex dihydrolipoamide acetyltransferase [Plasmopara halstedii]|eukprot:XP_024582546.1 pyruvate dehydrogenase complex dihydrolipoamide acetyltransferase [Plasmopara halstedii]
MKTAARSGQCVSINIIYVVHNKRKTLPDCPSYKKCVATFGSLPDHEVVGLPALSPTMEMGTIAKWNKQEGDPISAGDVVCEVETDKAVVDYEATDDSYLAKILVPAGSGEIAVGKPIFVTVLEEKDVAAFKDFSTDSSAIEAASVAPPVEVTPPTPSPSTPASSTSDSAAKSSGDRVFASPLARKIARESGAVLSVINGSGPNGRIVKADVEAALAAKSSNSFDKVEATSTGATIPTTATNYSDYPVSEESQTIAQQFTQQKLEVPHYHLSTSLVLDKLLDARARLNAGRGPDEQLSVNDFIVRAASLAMRKVPDANSSWKGSFIRQYKDVNVNLMVSSFSGGVVAPVLTQVNRKGLDAICQETQKVIAKAKDGNIEPDDLAIGTFTIANVGQFDVQSMAGIVRPEQACLLGLGTIEKKVVPNDDPNAEQIYKYAQVMTATLACDHRVIDGAVGAQWLATFKELVEDPLKMIL